VKKKGMTKFKLNE
jgi:hypothetical protein